MKRRTFGLLALAAVAAGGCAAAGGDSWGDAPGPKVLATFAPIECFARNVVGPDGQVRGIMTTQGPHHFDPTPADAKNFARADVFFSNGLGIDDTAAKRLLKAAGATAVRHAALATKIDETLLIEGECACCKGPRDAAHKDHSHDGDAHDPHAWAGIPQAVKMVEALRDELKLADPAHAAGYDARAAAYAGKLNAARVAGLEVLKEKKDRKFVCFHESLNYFAQAFDLTVAGVIEEVPGTEPTAKQLQDVVDNCVKKKVRVIAVEPQYTSKTAAEAVLKELVRRGVEDPQIVVLDPMETVAAGEMTDDWYVERVNANVAALAKALK